jgi:hypothetical protein
MCYATHSIKEVASINPLDISNYIYLTVHATLTSNNASRNSSSSMRPTYTRKLMKHTNTNTQLHQVLCYTTKTIKEVAITLTSKSQQISCIKPEPCFDI